MRAPENKTLTVALSLAGLVLLVCSQAAAQDGMESTTRSARIVHLPGDYSIGRAFIVEPQFDKKPLYHYALGWPNRMLAEVRGDVNVPAGKILRLDVWDSGPRAHRALAALGKDDVQILNFYQCDKADDRMLAAAQGLTGLKVLFLGQGRFTVAGLKHIAGFRKLVALQLPTSAPPESLDYLRGLASLKYLNISGPELTDAKLAKKIGQIPWLTQLSIAQLNQTQGLRHIANLKSLRYLNLQAVRDPGLDRNLAYISDLTELEEIDFEDSMIGDAGLANLRNMKKLKKLDLFSNPSTRRITDAGIANLKTLTSLEDVRLPTQSVTDTGLQHLAEMNSLKNLNLWSTRLTDTGIAVVARMKSLEELDVMCPNLTDAGFAGLCLCPRLKSLSINRCKVTDAGLANLKQLASLEYFAIDHAPVAGGGLGVLKECPLLREFALGFLDLDDTAISHIGEIDSLEKLRLYHIGAPVTDEGLRQLAGLTNLKTLSIVVKEPSLMPITDAGIEYLARLKNLETVWLSHCERITDEGLIHLEGLTRLEELRLDYSKVTLTGANRLKAAIPEISVTVPATMRSAGQRTPSSSTRRIAPGSSTDRTQTRRR